MEPRYSRIIPRILQDSRHLTRMMDVFDKEYRIFRIVLKIVGLWPYDNSFYVWIQRLWLLTSFLLNIIFQVTKIIIFSYLYNFNMFVYYSFFFLDYYSLVYWNNLYLFLMYWLIYNWINIIIKKPELLSL